MYGGNIVSLKQSSSECGLPKINFGHQYIQLQYYKIMLTLCILVPTNFRWCDESFGNWDYK